MNEIYTTILSHLHPISRRELWRQIGRLVYFNEKECRACFEIKPAWLKLATKEEEQIVLKKALNTCYKKDFTILISSSSTKQINKQVDF